MKKFAIASLAAAMAITATPAFAGSSEAPTMSVSTSGLDLATPEGQELLDARIDRAAREVCNADAVSTGTRIKSAETRRCVDRARTSAKQQMASVVAQSQLGG